MHFEAFADADLWRGLITGLVALSPVLYLSIRYGGQRR